MATATEPTLLDKLHELRKTKVDAWAELISARETDRTKFEERSASDAKPTDEDIEAFRSAEVAFKADSDLREAEIRELDERIRQHTEIVDRRAAAAAEHRGMAVITDQPLAYNPGNAREISYFRDLAAVTIPQATIRTVDVTEARDRLTRHAKEMEVEQPKRAEARERRARGQVDNAEGRSLADSPFERRVNPNRTDGQGGYFVPPLWLVDEYIPLLRAGRIASGLCTQMDLPEGTDSINIPKLNTGTAVGVQGADGGAVTSQDYTDTAVQANVKTLAGQEDVALQLIEQSPGQIVDRVIMTDLMAAYNQLVDQQIISGNGAQSAALNGGQLLGILPTANWAANAVTNTQGSPTGQLFNPVLGSAASVIARTRFNLQNVKYLLHPRRWFWFATSPDANGRPLVESNGFGPWNVTALEEGEAPAEGLVGQLPFGPEVYIDANVPTNDTTGGGTGQDVGIAAKWDDLWLFEGEMRTRVLPEVLSGTLELRYQVYNYVAFLVRYGQSIAVIAGSGMAAPSNGSGGTF